MKMFQNSKTLIVEGKSDKSVIMNLLEKFDIQHLEIIDKEGFSRLAASIKNEIRVPERKKLGIIADANDSFINRKKSIIYNLNQSRIFDIPLNEENLYKGHFKGKKDFEVGIWLMPNNKCDGELEDFVRNMIPNNDTVFPCAKKFIDELPKPRKFKDRKVCRAEVHAWLSTREKPRQMGTAIVAGDLCHDSEYAKAFVDWFKTLFL